MRACSPFGSLNSPGRGWFPQLRPPFDLSWWVARAVWLELLGFRFEYPIELVPEAGPRSSLHYYIRSEQLFFDMMELDADGIPCHKTRTLGKFYNPAYVAWYGLMKLEQSLQSGRSSCEAFCKQAQWLIKNAATRPDGSVVWYFPVDFQHGEGILKAPWPSAMIQGLVISVLVRAYRQSPDPILIDLCRSALPVYATDINKGGVRTEEGGEVLFEEYPVYPLPRVLDGFLFSLLGLYDLWIEAGDPLAKSLFDAGIRGLLRRIEFWDYKNRWSWYGSHSYLAPPHYNTLNRLLLLALARLSGEKILASQAQMWDPTRLDALHRLRLFLAFVVLKNRSRLRG